jgi:D-glycero-alpha-D-manno-heptose-7-phosphate kinase
MKRRARAPLRIDFAGGTTDIPPFPKKYGGAVINAAINKYVTGILEKSDEGLSLRYDCNLPTHFGLGTSGAMTLVWLALVLNSREQRELADRSFDIEEALGLTAGKQDQYASALGGINFLQFLDDKVKVTKVKLPRKTTKKIEKNLILCYDEKIRKFHNLNKFIMDKLAKKNKTVINSLKNIRDVAYEMKRALQKNKLTMFAELMNLEWENRRRLFPKEVTDGVNNLIKKGLNNGAIGAKVCGSCNGGVVLFYTEDKKALKKECSKFKHVNHIDFKFDFKGLQLK